MRHLWTIEQTPGNGVSRENTQVMIKSMLIPANPHGLCYTSHLEEVNFHGKQKYQ